MELRERGGDVVVRTYFNYVRGEWIPTISGEVLESRNPATGEVVAYSQASTVEDVNDAVNSAVDALARSDWTSNSHRRFKALLKWAQLIEEHQSELAIQLTMENGKPIREARTEVAGAIDSLQYYAGMARNVFGRTFQPAEDNLGFITKEPVGVVAIITPWNWPVLLLFRDLAPALAAGNAVVVKPAEKTGAITARFFELLDDVPELPKGIVTLVTGKGSVIGNAIVEHPLTDMICFTGSTKVGKGIMERAAHFVKKVALELGGKSPNLVFDDADLEKAVATSCRSLFMTSGQICMAGSRLLLQEGIYDRGVELAKRYAENLIVGNGMYESTDMGPIISGDQFETIMRYIEEGRRLGNIVTGGYRLEGPEYDQGYFIAPTIIEGLGLDCSVVQEEIFGPVLVVEKFRTEQQAIDMANATPYGLTAGVWTQDVSRAFRVSRAIRAGTVWVNGYNKNFAEAESGGFKQSGLGRARGIEGLMEFTETKHINLSF
ncbi:MAG TPA: aldehyde dehydrogenase family protein [Alicyclobacillus sp.]|nr:aldehyde dehydrogenase family protein [Alicyclobacillus sp.]